MSQFKSLNEISKYLMAIDNGCSCSMYNLGNYYQNVEKNYDLMKKYYLMAIENGYVIEYKNDNSLEDNYVKWLLGEKVNSSNIIILVNKINFTSINDTCPTCLDEKQCIRYECTHITCVDCYVRVMTEHKKCPICRVNL